MQRIYGKAPPRSAPNDMQKTSERLIPQAFQPLHGTIRSGSGRQTAPYFFCMKAGNAIDKNRIVS